MAEIGIDDFLSEMDHVLLDRCQNEFYEIAQVVVVLPHFARCILC